ncbi:LysR family transcriptional regulator [Pseudorhodobacter sp.]|uniref:LysR family transcriptional regulator n=1 Tax=Pseudorhodobacter sp. TaxID=1934400 RepID=UPI002648E78C|nr:LysR family transcriptional regulator [Pseudorhodobacter sp.]MDN5788871.1 LysR family transcriptional regulator [Pseudorhodobacter sp.]
MTRPNLRQIEAVLAVAETGNFSRAAERLGMTQPGVSQAVREIESLLNLRLFDRTTRRVVLTPAGRAFRDGAVKSIEALDGAVAEAQDIRALRAGFLRLAAPPFLAATVLPRVLVDFQSLHPGVALELVDTTTEQILARIAAGQADLGLGTFPPGLAEVGHRPVLRDEMMAFTNATAELPVDLRWADLAAHPIIVLTRKSALRLPVELGFEAAGLTLRPAFEVEQIATALALAGAGLGVAILPGYARAGMMPGTGLTAHVLTAPTIRREVALIYAVDRSLSPAAAAFADHLTHSLRKLAP